MIEQFFLPIQIQYIIQKTLQDQKENGRRDNCLLIKKTKKPLMKIDGFFVGILSCMCSASAGHMCVSIRPVQNGNLEYRNSKSNLCLHSWQTKNSSVKIKFYLQIFMICEALVAFYKILNFCWWYGGVLFRLPRTKECEFSFIIQTLTHNKNRIAANSFPICCTP